LIHRLVFENLKHRPVRTLLSAIAIGLQVTIILTLVGVSNGMLDDVKTRSRGTGADILIRPPDSTLIGNSGNISEEIVGAVREVPHVTLATGTLVQPIGNLDSITGIHLDEFNQMSGGFDYLEKLGDNPFQQPNDLMVDEVYARSNKLHVGQIKEFGRPWRVTAVVGSGKLSRMFAEIRALQQMFSARGMISMVLVKVDDPANIQPVLAALRAKLETYKIYTVEEYVSLISADNIPMLKEFTGVVVGIGVVGGFLVVFLSMYMVVLERTREIGILKALGASPGYILGILLRETVLLAIAGTIAGILMTYGTQQLMNRFVPTMTQETVMSWWPWAALIALTGSLIGAIYPGLKAARLDPIEALSYD
jgi:putative ABC transport system permease protein